MKKLINLIAFGFVVLNLSAQQIPVVTQYIYNPYIYNPAFAGREENKANIWVSHKRQWVNMPDAPYSTIQTIDVQIPKTKGLGLGLVLYNDKAHIISNTGGQLAIAYHLALNKKKDMHISAALSLGLVHQQFSFNDATIKDQIDPTILSKGSSSNVFDMTAGINFDWRGLNIGASFPQVLNNKAVYKQNDADKASFTYARHYLVNASYKFNIKKFTIQPNLMGRFVKAIPPQIDAHLLFGWNNTIFLGGGYRNSNDITKTAGANGTLMVRIKNIFSIGYTFESGVSSRDYKVFGGSHEVIVGFHLGTGSKKDEKKLKELEKEVEKNKELAKLTKEQRDSLELANGKQKEEIDNLTAQAKAKDEALEKLEKDNQKSTQTIKELIEKNEAGKNTASVKTRYQTTLGYKKLGDVFFDKNSSVLNAKIKSDLDALYAEVLKKDNYMLYVGGNASNEGSNDYNLWLADRRAEQTMKYLLQKGVPQSKIMVLSYGSRYANTDVQEYQRSVDRRVDIFISE